MNAGNPQGKGLCTVVSALRASRPAVIVQAKQIKQVVNEWFTSMFVLSSRFQFKPVVGQNYWLYRNGPDDYQLSLIGPFEWPDGHNKFLVGRCQLQSDLTWTLNLSDQAQKDVVVQSELVNKWREFEHDLESAASLEQHLPVYDDKLSYYARVFASGLAYSLKLSMQQTGLLECDYRKALKQLAHT